MSVSVLPYMHTARVKTQQDQTLFEVMFQVQQFTLLSLRIRSREDVPLGVSVGRGPLQGQPQTLDYHKVWQSRPHRVPLGLRLNHRLLLYLLRDFREVSLRSISCLI